MQYFAKSMQQKFQSKLSIEDHENRQPLGLQKPHNKNAASGSSSYLKNFKKMTQMKSNHVNNNDQSYGSINSNGSRGSRRCSKTKPVFEEQDTNHRQNQISRQFQQSSQFKYQENNQSDNPCYQQVLNETDNSMQQMLNSSINHFEKMLMQEGSHEFNNTNHNLQEQNQHLKSTLQKLKYILKEKLESALKKQKEQLSRMLEDYVSLIRKLLQDKEQLSISLHDAQQKYLNLEVKLEEQFEKKLQNALAQRDEQISMTKKQIDEFLDVISQYQEEAKQETENMEEMQARIDELEQEKQRWQRANSKALATGNQSSEAYIIKIEALETKVQTLLELVEKAQEENHQLREQLRKNQHSGPRDLRQHYEARFEELQAQHEEQFIQYERAIKQTIAKKDECIQRLSLIIEGLKSRRNPLQVP